MKIPVRLGRVHKLSLTVAVAGILLVSFFPLANLSYDFSAGLTAVMKPRVPLENAALIFVNNQTLHDLGNDQGLLKRTDHARLLDILAAERARMVFYDFVFTDSNVDPRVDTTLAGAIHHQGSVFLAAAGESSADFNAPKDVVIRPLPLLTAQARGWGHAEIFGNVVRQISGDYVSTPYAIWVAASNCAPQEFARQDRNAERWLNYYGSPDQSAFLSCPFEDVLRTNYPPGFFTGKFVFVGQSLPTDNPYRIKDSFTTPYTLFGEAPMPGVEIHATALLNLLRNDWLRRTPQFDEWLLAAAWGIIITVTLYWLSRKPTLVVVAAVAGAVLICGVSLCVQWHFHWWWAWIGPAMAQPLVAVILVLKHPKPDPYIAFISYRTEEDGATAQLVAGSLSERGHKTFIDVTSLEMGRFDEQLLDKIESARVFIIILSPNTLRRCNEKNDWVLRELSHALAKGKSIIPVMKTGFSFDAPELVPDLPEIVALRNYQGVPYSLVDFEGFMNRLAKLIIVSKK